MLFNSYEFILVFLPLTAAAFFLTARLLGKEAALGVLVAASLVYYGWWRWSYLPLLVASIVANFVVGRFLEPGDDDRSRPYRKTVMVVGIACNLGLLGYFKYANFFIDNLAELTGAAPRNFEIILPLAISFFTFQQVAYLVDAHRGETKEHSFLHYCLFVTFFPQLIAGPIVHHKEMLPQFSRDETYSVRAEMVAVGLSVFVIGLFKKVVLADSLASYASPLFAFADSGGAPSFLHAWGGALAYTFQLYFDFSGYSDMAMGIAFMFGIRLPLNFDSPYKASNIIDFWRRWHISLSRFLRDYLYFPLGGNRRGKGRRYANLLITMLLGGLWHGAGWTFVIWGVNAGVNLTHLSA
jgi:D-alanyl-lipoteichoic acid acyltransferase DltB (MBOAT superfamily)